MERTPCRAGKLSGDVSSEFRPASKEKIHFWVTVEQVRKGLHGTRR